MDLNYFISQHIEANINTAQQTLSELTPAINQAGQLIANTLLNGNKILSCDDEISINIAQLFSSIMLNNFEMARPSLPAITLSSKIINKSDGSYDIFSRQVRALGNAEDVLLTNSLTGHSKNILQAIEAAHERDLRVVSLNGYEGGEIATFLRPQDIEIRIPSENNARIQEIQLLVIHTLCDLVDKQLFNH